jgi:hypothetical protein
VRKIAGRLHDYKLKVNAPNLNSLKEKLAEDAVRCELLSAIFPANREKYRDILVLITIPEQLALDRTACWPRKLSCFRESEQGTKRL